MEKIITDSDETIELTENTETTGVKKTKEIDTEAPMGLGERMKIYETNSLNVVKILPTQSFIVRLDGRSFSKFTSGLKKPFDEKFTQAMVLTTKDLLNEFSAITGYTHSDEITIIFQKMLSEEEEAALKKENKEVPVHVFDGRVVKILTTMSAYCSVRFNFHLVNIIKEDNGKYFNYKEGFLAKLNAFQAVFDARLVLFPKEKENEEIINHMIWRSMYDCERNAVSTYARSYFSQKELHGKKKGEMIQMMEKEKGFKWETDAPLFWRHGVYLKKQMYDVEVTNNNPHVNGVLICKRRKVVAKCFKVACNEDYFKIIFSPLYELSSEEEFKLGIENYLL